MTEYLNDHNFKESIKEGVVLVDFTATWCGPCKMMSPIIDALSAAMKGKAKVFKLDIDQASDTASILQITSVPTMILFKNGVEVKRVVGVKEIGFLEQLIESGLK
jgi:thioredoxin 1